MSLCYVPTLSRGQPVRLRSSSKLGEARTRARAHHGAALQLEGGARRSVREVSTYDLGKRGADNTHKSCACLGPPEQAS